MSIVERLQRIAKEQGTNFKKIEQNCGIGNGTMRRWDVQSPRLDKIKAVADYLNISIDYLVYGSSVSATSSAEPTKVDIVLATMFPYLKMSSICSPCTDSSLLITRRTPSNWFTPNTSGMWRRKRALFIRLIATRSPTPRTAPGAMMEGPRWPDFLCRFCLVLNHFLVQLLTGEKLPPLCAGSLGGVAFGQQKLIFSKMSNCKRVFLRLSSL